MNILKDSGCNTNIVSQELVERMRKEWADKIEEKEFRIVHSKNDPEENSYNA